MNDRKAFTLQFVGTGNAVTKPPANFNTSALVSIDNRRLLLDCGTLGPLGLAEMGVHVRDIEAVFITHLHGDHVFGLEELLFSQYFGCPRLRPQVWLPDGLVRSGSAPEGYDIWDNCLRASMESTVVHDGAERVLQFEDYADIHILKNHQKGAIFGLPVVPFDVLHVRNRPAYGIILDNRVAYTSDTTFSRERIEWLLDRGIERIFHDVFFKQCHGSAVHTSFRDLSGLPHDIASHIWLMHYCDGITEEIRLDAVNRGFHFAERGAIYQF